MFHFYTGHPRLSVRQRTDARHRPQGAGLGSKQSRVAFPVRGIAAASCRLESRTIEHAEGAAVVLDQPAALQRTGGHGDTDTAHAQHVGEKLVRVSSQR